MIRVAALALSSLLAGCDATRSDAVHARVEFVASGSRARLTDLSLIVGGDRVGWPELAPGESKRANLLPGLRDDRQPILLYRQGDEKRVWEGPAMPAGAGYRIVIRIEADGTASARHCLSPCSLE